LLAFLAADRAAESSTRQPANPLEQRWCAPGRSPTLDARLRAPGGPWHGTRIHGRNGRRTWGILRIPSARILPARAQTGGRRRVTNDGEMTGRCHSPQAERQVSHSERRRDRTRLCELALGSRRPWRQSFSSSRTRRFRPASGRNQRGTHVHPC